MSWDNNLFFNLLSFIYGLQLFLQADVFQLQSTLFVQGKICNFLIAMVRLDRHYTEYSSIQEILSSHTILLNLAFNNLMLLRFKST